MPRSGGKRGEQKHVQASRGQESLAVQPPAVQVFVLGGFKVVVRSQVLPEHAWRRKTARQLFKILLSRPNRRMTRDEVIELLWPESDPEAASSNLRSTLFALRRALEPSTEPASIAVIFSDRDGVWLRPDVELWVDADAFEHTVDQAWRSADPLPLLEQAGSLYAGHYLPEDLYEDWATERREALKHRWAEVQIRLAHELERRGDPDAAVRHLQGLMQDDPCDERSAQELMRVLARHERRADALRVYQRLVQALAEELDVKPSDETAAVHRQIAAGELGEPPVGTTFRCAYPFPAPDELIGREAELAVLERILVSGRTVGQAAVVGAPVGTGKSALVGQLIKRAQAQGVLCLAGGCYEERGAVPLGPFHDALMDFLLAQSPDRIRAELGSSAEDLAQVVPELRYHLKLAEVPSPGPTNVDRTRTFGAIHACLRGLAEKGPALICLEDLHAADEATLQLFHYLARQTRRLPLVLVGTYRSDEAEADQPLAKTLATLVRERLAQRIALSTLGRDDADRMVGKILQGLPSKTLGESLFETTGGNPLFIEQQVMALLETGQLQQTAGVWHGTTELRRLPQIVRDVIAQRLNRLPASCRDVLAMAAILGKSFDHAVILGALEPLDESSLLEDLDRALAAQVLQETATGYSFRHALLREAVYWEMSAPRRMLLHGRAGDLLERLHGQQAHDYAGELAHHFGLAGASRIWRARALFYSMHAGRRAAQLSSHAEALTHFAKACDLIDADEGLGDPSTRLQALEGRGQAEADLAMWSQSQLTFRQALNLSDDPIRRAKARGRIAFTHQHRGEMRLVITECEAALSELAGIEGQAAAAARLYPQQLIAIVLYLEGRYHEVVRLGRTMESAAPELGPGTSTPLVQLVLGWGYMGQGQVELALAEYAPGLAAAQRSGEKVVIAAMHENIGFQEYLGGRFDSAREHLATALALYRDSASELRAVNALQHLCRVWVAEGELTRAREQLMEAVALEAEGQERWAADGHHILGQIESVRANWAAAAASFQLALNIRKQVGDTCGIVESTVGFGLVEQHAGRWDTAAAAFSEAVAVAETMDPAPCRVLALRQRGRLQLLLGDVRAAEADVDEAATLAQTIPETLEYAPTLLAEAELCIHEGKLERALSLAKESLLRARPLEQIAEAHIALAQIYLSLGALGEAVIEAAEGLARASQLDSPRIMSLAHLAMARVQSWRGDPEAVAPFDAALSAAEAAGAPHERAAVLESFAQHLERADVRADEAAAMAAEASAIQQRLRIARDSSPRVSIS